ncbi:heat-inducible transcription repressor HrcA [Thermus scotoductus SA-01]|uniref:Heat-inducible transcription repressor HrcA n=1 Tax=Thermus scotoductus (strain ATCC 700910 / SA-01) TaxID=743525 RepID=E8PQM0_THESS|nr:heat-inducible transcription repressor HrcA [Thermus scotoductus SA-01]
MTARQRALLHLLVEEYIRTKTPVPSARLAEGLGLSPALARYELIALEEMGYLSKPHASAGRVPTRQAFRQYSLSLLPPKPLPEATQERLQRALEGAREPEAFLVKMAVGLSGYPALLRLRPRNSPKVLQVHLSPLPEGTLAVFVLEGGRVKEARLPLSLPTERLRKAEEALSGPFAVLPPAPRGLEELFAHLSRALSAGLSLVYREGLAEALKGTGGQGSRLSGAPGDPLRSRRGRGSPDPSRPGGRAGGGGGGPFPGAGGLRPGGVAGGAGAPGAHAHALPRGPLRGLEPQPGLYWGACGLKCGSSPFTGNRRARTASSWSFPKEPGSCTLKKPWRSVFPA